VGCVLAIIIFVICVIIGLFISALCVGAVGAVFLDWGFWDAYHAGWDRWGWLLVFSIFVFGGGSSAASRN
jgi:hypothetical protein